MLPGYRDLWDLIKHGANFEAQQKIAELQEAHLDLRAENLRLKEENAELKRKLNVSTSVTWEEPAYYRLVGDAKDGPFCQKCFDSNDKLIRLQSRYGYSDLSCLVCGQGYSLPAIGKSP